MPWLKTREFPMVIMEPVKGGSLSKLPQDLASRLKEAAPNSSISSWSASLG